MTLDTLRYNPLPVSSSPPAPADGEIHATETHTGQLNEPLSNTNSFLVTPLPTNQTAPLPCQSNGHPYPDSPSPSPPCLHKPKRLLHSDVLRPSGETRAAHAAPPPPLAHHDKAELVESSRKQQVLQSSSLASPLKKEPGAVQNGRTRPLERFTPESFAQHFHQAVLQSTHSMLQSKGWTLGSRWANCLSLFLLLVFELRL